MSHGGRENAVSIQLEREDRDYLERVASAKPKPTKRQKAQALLGLAEGETLEKVSMHVGISRDVLEDLVARFSEGGLAGVGLGSARGRKDAGPRMSRSTAIEKTPGVCGGAARIAGTRIPIWQLIEARRMGASEAQLLLDYPGLQAKDLAEAWDYARAHPEEIDAEIVANEIA